MAAMWRAQCAFARLFTGKTGPILNHAVDFGTKLAPESLSVLVSRNYSNYKNSPLVHKITEQYEYEIVKNPAEWTYVERLLPFETIPEVQPKAKYPSGWVPPKEEALELPYFISRTKNHSLPIYLQLKFKGGRKITMIRKIDGDIWQMNDEIKEFLKEKMKRYVETRVHELGRFIEVKGDYVNDLRDWAHSKGF
ncbi:large ribosomal subunit protein mL49 [Cydia pomonella]|uniref:large ribosomal subunit protein mL49 n=1 Tax=Cydia pomonella TaxID=82600 RepID=UPI002ADE4328|nr:large ribosomal subunit protein mL49 [Cydia pomonella]